MYSKFERRLKVKPLFIAKMLGITPSKYELLKMDDTPQKLYFEYSVIAHSHLSKNQLAVLVDQRPLFETEQRNQVSRKLRINCDIESLCKELEEKAKLGPVDTARLLGMVYQRYNEMRNGSRLVQLYQIYSIEAHLSIPKTKLKMLIEERIDTGYWI